MLDLLLIHACRFSASVRINMLIRRFERRPIVKPTLAAKLLFAIGQLVAALVRFRSAPICCNNFTPSQTDMFCVIQFHLGSF